MENLGPKMNIKLKHAGILFFGSLLFAISINIFIGPGGLYVGCITGLLQILVMFAYDFYGIQLSLGLLIFVMNVPLLWMAWASIGRRFAILTLVSVILQSILIEVVPYVAFSEDMMLNGIFGGVIMGFGSGIILKIGASGGGVDVLSQVLAYKFDGTVGKYVMYINIIVLAIAGLYQNWEVAMFTMIGMYITTVIIDRIHTIHRNLTMFIITEKEDEVIGAIWLQLARGITVTDSKGAFHRQKVSTLMMVLSSHELYEAAETIKSVDEKAFINVVSSEAVFGNFSKTKILY